MEDPPGSFDGVTGEVLVDGRVVAHFALDDQRIIGDHLAGQVLTAFEDADPAWAATLMLGKTTVSLRLLTDEVLHDVEVLAPDDANRTPELHATLFALRHPRLPHRQ